MNSNGTYNVMGFIIGMMKDIWGLNKSHERSNASTIAKQSHTFVIIFIYIYPFILLGLNHSLEVN